MCFEIKSPGVYKYRGVKYHEVDCGGGGNCLFLSLAYLLRFHNLDAAATHQNVRKYAADIFEDWSEDGFPDWVDEQQFELPDTEEAEEMGHNGEWGTKTAALAVVEHYGDFHVTILGPDTDDVYHVENLSDDDARPTIYLFYSGYNHYRALIPKDEINRVPDGMRVDKADERKLSSTLFASLKTSTSSASLNNTSSAAGKSYLEIHHIDVGQGDCTLIYVKDENQSIVKSILIDTGLSFNHVSDYLKTRISYGDFRPIDILIISHWDKDHMGAAAALIRKGKYTQRNLRIIDLGDPESEDQDALHFLKEFGDHPGRELPSLEKPLVDDCLGLTLSCYMFNGLFGSPKGKGYVRSFQDWNSYPLSGFFPDSDGEMTERIISARNSYFPPIKDKNNRSIALVISFHGFRYYTGGDLSGDYEKLVAQAINQDFKHCCAWKLGHHGAAEASSPETLQYLLPRFGVVSCGTDNEYGHPSGAAIEHLDGLNKFAPCDYYVTNRIPPKASGKKFQPGQITGIAHAKDAEGDIIIKVSSADKDKHKFQVYSNSSPKGIEFNCGVRKFDESNKIKKSAKRSFREMSSDDNAVADKRRRDRLAKILPVIKKILLEHGDVDDSWVDNARVMQAMKIVAGRIRRNFGEDCAKEKIEEIINAKLRGRDLDSAADLDKALRRQ